MSPISPFADGMPLGSNAACTATSNNDISTTTTATTTSTRTATGQIRIRRDWDVLDEWDREQYLDAVETAIERGYHDAFARFHAEKMANVQAHETCGFFLWHRRFTLAYENMLRSLEPRFRCLTIPFWDIFDDYKRQVSPAEKDKWCRSYGTCASIVNDLGGLVDSDAFYDRQFNGIMVDGHLHNRPPVQNLYDDNQNSGIIRYDMWFDPIPPSADGPDLVRDLFGGNRSPSLATFWRRLQRGIHDDVHDTIGGFMRTHMSPIDPTFFPWHSTIDLIGFLYETCHYNPETVNKDAFLQNILYPGEACLYTNDAKKRFPEGVDLALGEMYVKDSNESDVRLDSLIGQFWNDPSLGLDFREVALVGWLSEQHYRYSYADIPMELRKLLTNETDLCPLGLGSLLADDSDMPTNFVNPSLGRTAPRVNESQLQEMQTHWRSQAQEYYSSHGGEDYFEHRMSWIDCILDSMDRDTLERWAIDDSFDQAVLLSDVINKFPLCSIASIRESTLSPSALSGHDVSVSSSSYMLRSGLLVLCIAVFFRPF